LIVYLRDLVVQCSGPLVFLHSCSYGFTICYSTFNLQSDVLPTYSSSQPYFLTVSERKSFIRLVGRFNER